MQSVRYGILGSGFMGRTHVEALQHIEGATCTAIGCGTRAPQLAEEYGAAFCETAEELIERDDVDAVIVATPQYVHAEQSLAAAAQGKHLFIEKPMTTTVEDADRIIAACKAGGLCLSVGYQQRYRTVPRATYEQMQNGAIGKVHTIQFFQVFQLFTDPAFGGDWSWWANLESVGHILAGGVHGIDMCRWLLGAEVKAAFAHCGTFREPHGPENTTMGLLTFDNGTVMSLWASSACPEPGFPGIAFRAQMMGETGMIDMDAYTTLRMATEGEWREIAEQPPVNTEYADTAFRQPRMQAYIDQLAVYQDALLGGTEPPVTGWDGRQGVAAALALLESSHSGQMITLA